MTQAQSQVRIGMVLDGQYRLDRLLGEGGVGAVYAAWHMNLSKQVAVKLLHPQFAGHGESLERFQREARILSGLGHPAFVTVYDFGHAEDGTAYMVMEMIEGETLRGRLQRGLVLSVPEVLALFRPLCEAMEKAHQKGILHRDLKPDNLMLVKGGGVKILDFGMAKLMSDVSHLTSAKVVMGTPNYLAPERARGRQDADARSDIFALGAILYEALTGRFAFYGATAMDTMLKVISSPVTKLELPDSAQAKRLDEVIAKACAKDATGRYQSAAEMLHGVETAVTTAAQHRPENQANGGTPSPSPSKGLSPDEKPTIKAAVVQAIFEFINSRRGESSLRDFSTRFGQSRAADLLSKLPTSKVDASILNELHDLANNMFDDGSLGLMRELGGHFADLALGSIYKAFLTPAGPQTLLKRVHIMHSMMTESGGAQITQLSTGSWRIQVRGLSTMTPSMTAATAGWVRRYLEVAGAKEIVVEDTFRIEDGGPLGEIDLSFRSPYPEEIS